MVAVCFLKMLIMIHCIQGIVKNQHFQSTLLEGRGVTKKEYSVYAFDNVDNYGGPLTGGGGGGEGSNLLCDVTEATGGCCVECRPSLTVRGVDVCTVLR